MRTLQGSIFTIELFKSLCQCRQATLASCLTGAFFIIMGDITEQDIQRLSKRRGSKNAARLLSILGKDKQFLKAWESPIGKPLMQDLLKNAESLLEKIIEDKATPEEKAEFRVIRRWLIEVASRINAYYSNLNTLKGAK